MEALRRNSKRPPDIDLSSMGRDRRKIDLHCISAIHQQTRGLRSEDSNGNTQITLAEHFNRFSWMSFTTDPIQAIA
jgi:hypothetical protein